VFSKILTALILAGGTGALYAGPVYSCGGGSACNGNLYAVWVVSQTATSYVLDVGVQVTNNYLTTNGGPGQDSNFIDALAIIPDNQGSSTGATLTGHAAGIWNLQSGSSTGGCKGTAAPFVCAGANGMGANLFSEASNGLITPNTQIWQFTIIGTPPSLGNTTQLQVRYINSLGITVGNSGSFNIAIQCIGGGTCDTADFADAAVVPEPMPSALIGSGLIGLYFLRRRLPG
jgi:hypothetical protein